MNQDKEAMAFVAMLTAMILGYGAILFAPASGVVIAPVVVATVMAAIFFMI
jgi:hypothetical protein